jgi:site-specific DNA recombinase
MNMSISTALYARVSSHRQAEEMTIDSQVAAIKERITRDGFTVEQDRCYLDEGYSGSTLVRPALERLRDLAHAGGLDRLYVHAPDRLARKYVYQMLLLEEFSRHSVQVVFVTGDPQHQTPEGNLLLQVQGMIAEYERARILERTRRGRRYAARQGKVSALAHAPYGYRYVTKRDGGGEARYDIVLEEARVVRELFAWVGVEGLTLGQVVRRLAEQQVPSPAGNPSWDRATIHGMLLQPAYTGTAKFGKTRLVPRIESKRAKRGDPPVPRRPHVERATQPHEQEPISVPALISEDLFSAVTERLAENRRRQRTHREGGEFLLSGLLVCHRCRSAYCGRRSPRKSREPYVYYRCLGTDKFRHGGEAICTNCSVSGPPLEESVWADLCELLRQPDRLQRELERRMAQPSPAADADYCAATVMKLKGRLARLLDAYEHGCLEQSEFLERTTRVRERLVREEASQKRFQESQREAADLRLIVGHLETFAGQVSAGLASADFATKRKLLRLLIHRIEIDTDEVRIIYKVQSRPFVLRPDRGELHHCLQFRAATSWLVTRNVPTAAIVP